MLGAVIHMLGAAYVYRAGVFLCQMWCKQVLNTGADFDCGASCHLECFLLKEGLDEWAGISLMCSGRVWAPTETIAACPPCAPLLLFLVVTSLSGIMFAGADLSSGDTGLYRLLSTCPYFCRVPLD